MECIKESPFDFSFLATNRIARQLGRPPLPQNPTGKTAPKFQKGHATTFEKCGLLMHFIQNTRGRKLTFIAKNGNAHGNSSHNIFISSTHSSMLESVLLLWCHNITPTNNALLINFRLSSDAEILLISTD